jgi:predicted lipoprotein with Yx(FWY)xxD motif
VGGVSVRVSHRAAAAILTATAATALSLWPGSQAQAARITSHDLHGPTDVVRVMQATGGPVIANGAGMALYVFVDDLLTSAPSACTGDCRNDWSAAIARGRVKVAAGITGHIGTVERPGEGRQLTMDGRPLYTFSGDLPGETRGNGVGNLWWAMTPTGLSATAYPAQVPTYDKPGPTTLTVVRTIFGPVVADSQGQVLYDYADDTPTTSACQASWCLVDWPPLRTPGSPTAVPAITAPLGVIVGAGGVRQVTLGGHPLYTFAGDLHPGDVRGQAIGSDWYLVSPSGKPVMTTAQVAGDGYR